ncbi:MAG: hypothetical protein WAZ12_03445 [Candidatus Absconditicoccaceae bacterium]
MKKSFQEWIDIFDDKSSSEVQKEEAKRGMIQEADSFYDWNQFYIRSSSSEMEIVRKKLSELKEIL